jgi:hypothetical protein
MEAPRIAIDSTHVCTAKIQLEWHTDEACKPRGSGSRPPLLSTGYRVFRPGILNKDEPLLRANRGYISNRLRPKIEQ